MALRVEWNEERGQLAVTGNPDDLKGGHVSGGYVSTGLHFSYKRETLCVNVFAIDKGEGRLVASMVCLDSENITTHTVSGRIEFVTASILDRLLDAIEYS